MNATVYNGIDVFREAVVLLDFIANDKAPMETKKSLINKYGVSPDVLEKPFDVCSRLFAEGKKRLKSKMSVVKDYFTVYKEDGNLSKAAVTLLINDSEYQKGLQERKQECLTKGEAQRSQEFYHLISTGYSLEVEDGDAEEKCTSLRGVLECLNEADYTAEQKWQLQWVFNHPREAFEEIEPCIQTAMEVIESKETLWRPLVEAFEKSWQERLRVMTFYEYIRKEMSFFIEENPLGIVIMPQIVGLNQLVLATKSKEKAGDRLYQDICRIGTVVDKVGLVQLCAESAQQKHYIAFMLKLLADESKLEILSLLKERKYYGGELAKKLNLTTATISHHMSILVSNGLVTVNKDMNRLYYELNQETIRKLLDNTRELLLK